MEGINQQLTNIRGSALELQASNSPEARKAEEKKTGKGQVTEILTDLYGGYKELETLGADVSTDRSGVRNVWERAAGSGAGQLVAGALGTKAQAVRDRINQNRPLLLAAIKQATGLSATQMNSNVELQFYIQAATDVTKERWANRAALAQLDKLYGLGSGVTSDPEDIAKLEAMKPAGSIAPQGKPVGGGFSIRRLP
jgi:hypothetical protein